MEINILAFGIIKDLVGGPIFQIELNCEDLSVKELRVNLEGIYPNLKSLSSYMIALNNRYAEENERIKSTYEIALIPPVSGG